MTRDAQLWIMVDAWLQAKGKRFDVELPHVAAEDAEIQIRHFFQEL